MKKITLIIAVLASLVFANTSEKEDVRHGIMAALNASISFPTGYGVTLGGILDLYSILHMEYSLIYRTPAANEISIGDGKWERVETKEIAIGLNFLFRKNPFGVPFYWEGGLQFGVPIVNFDYDGDRSKFDFGPILGFGWNINENFAIGLKCSYALTDFGNAYDYKFIYSELGLSYMF